MEVCVTFDSNSAIKESLSIVHKLGEGKFSAYEAYSPSHNTTYCLKIFPKNATGTSHYRKEQTIANFDHPNVIQHVPLKCHSPKFHGIATEVARYGDFFEFVTKGCLDTEALVRTYFHQLIAGIEHIHSQGFAHLDLKLDNLMLGSKFTLKIIDFDQTQLLTDEGMRSAGTEGYRAPEVVSGECQNLAAADIFSAGILLYTFLAQEFPFAELEEGESEDDMCYSFFCAHNRTFWRKRAQTKGDESFFSSDIVQLINGMVHPNPDKRFSLQQIKASKWYMGPILSQVELRAQIKERVKALLKEREAPELSQP